MSFDTPQSYARQLATYISDPSTIRARTLAEFGKSPSLEACQKFRADHVKKFVPYKKASKVGDWYCDHPRVPDNVETALNGNDRCKICASSAKSKLREARAREVEIDRRRRAAIRLERERKLARVKALYIIEGDKPRPRLITETLDRIANSFGITREELTGYCKEQIYINARSVAVRVFRDSGLSYPRIASILNKQCHSTVIHLDKTFETRALNNPEIIAALRAVQ